MSAQSAKRQQCPICSRSVSLIINRDCPYGCSDKTIVDIIDYSEHPVGQLLIDPLSTFQVHVWCFEAIAANKKLREVRRANAEKQFRDKQGRFMKGRIQWLNFQYQWVDPLKGHVPEGWRRIQYESTRAAFANDPALQKALGFEKPWEDRE
jgi:hypothetical protein